MSFFARRVYITVMSTRSDKLKENAAASVVKYVKGPSPYKYTAILSNGRRVNFGDRNYEHYRDSVPPSKGGGLWSHKNHLDKKRRHNYRTRHAGVLTGAGVPAYKIKHTAAWFSYYYLW